jgi:hypothetical protein
MKVQECLVYFPSLKILKINGIILDSVVALLSRCPMLETFDINFFTQSLINHVPPSSKSLKFTNDDFAWTYIEIDSPYHGATTLGILDNLQSVVESYLDVFSSRESKFVDHILYLLRDKDLYEERETYMQLHRSTSKVKVLLLIWFIIYICVCVWFCTHIDCIITCCCRVQAVVTSHPCYKLSRILQFTSFKAHSSLFQVESSAQRA